MQEANMHRLHHRNTAKTDPVMQWKPHVLCSTKSKFISKASRQTPSRKSIGRCVVLIPRASTPASKNPPIRPFLVLHATSIHRLRFPCFRAEREHLAPRNEPGCRHRTTYNSHRKLEFSDHWRSGVRVLPRGGGGLQNGTSGRNKVFKVKSGHATYKSNQRSSGSPIFSITLHLIQEATAHSRNQSS